MKTLQNHAISTKAILSLLLFFLSVHLFAEATEQEAHSFPDYKHITHIHSASELDYPPYSIVTPEGKADGFSVELMRAALKTMGKDVDYKVGQWSVIKDELAKGKLDALPLVGRTPEREPLYDFTIPYIQLFGALIVRDDNRDIKSAKDLKGKELITMKGDNAEEFARRNALTEHITTTPSFEEALKLLSSGKGDAVLIQQLVGRQLIEKLHLTNLKMLPEPVASYRQDFSFAVTSGNKALLSILNEGLANTKADGTYDKLYAKWFEVPSKYTKENLLWVAIGVFSVALAIAVIVMLLLFYRRIIYSKRELEREVREATIEIQEAYGKFRTIFESSQDAIMLQDEHAFIDCNNSTLSLFGVTDKAQFIAHHPSDFSAAIQLNGEDAFTAANKQIAVALEQGSSHFEWVSKRLNGETFFADVLLTAFDYNGKRIIQANVRDITERHEARRTSMLLRRFFDNTNEGMVITDANGIITAVNPAFSTITGHTKEEAIGKNPRILKSGRHSQSFYEQMWSDILVKGRWTGEIENRRKNGELYTEWLTITPIRDESGKIENFVAVFLDLTPLKEKQKEIDEQERMLIVQSRFAAMGEMISMIAHQWRQPITAIGMGANNMIVDIEMGDIDAQVFRAHLESINNQVQFLSRTIDDFRDFFKPNRQMNSVPITDIIEASIQIVRKSLENSNITVNMEMEFNPVIMVHESELLQVLLAIVNNAKDALIEKAVKPAIITISTKANPDFPDSVELTICDNGGGVPEEIKQRIFEPYFTTKGVKSGTGLGLYIAKTIIEKHHNGKIGVENSGGGACFTMRLPVTKE